MFSRDREERFLAQQDDWQKWLGLSNWSVFGLRKKQYLFTYNPILRVYDSFFDKKELDELPESESLKVSTKFNITQKIKSFFILGCIVEEVGRDCPPKKTNTGKINALSKIIEWSDVVWSSEKPVDNLSHLVTQVQRENSKIEIGWLAYQALYQKKWTSLFELGQYSGNQAWVLVAQANLREPLSMTPDNCLKYFVTEGNKVENFYKYCQDSKLRRVVEGVGILKAKKRTSDSFWAQVSS